MESLLHSTIPDPPATIHDTKPLNEETPESLPIEKELATLVINETGSQKYIGAASGMSILSPRGLAWVERKTGTSRMRGIMREFQRSGHLWPSSKSGHQWNDFSSPRHNLPSKEAAIHLANHYFDFFNASFPLLDRRTFWENFERQYSRDADFKHSWFALLNIVLAIACITATDAVLTNVLICDPLCSTNMADMGSKYLQNACSMLSEVMLLDTDLTAVQVLMGMAFVMQASMNPEGAFTLMGTAARLAMTLGLHQWLEGFGLSKSELQQRQRVFWILYILEKDLSSRVARPSAIDDDDIDLDAALRRVDDDAGIAISFTSKDNQKFYAFKSMCALAVIQSKIYRELYRANSRRKTVAERIRSISRLDAELQDWKDSIPLEIRPEHQIQCDDQNRFPIMVLHCGYYGCLSSIHRANAHHEVWTSGAEEMATDANDLKESPASPSKKAWTNVRTQSSYALCLAAARSMLHLLIEFLVSKDDPRNSMLWAAPYFPFQAYMVLFTHLVQYPLDERANADMVLMERALTSLSLTILPNDASFSNFASHVLREFLIIVQEHVRNARAKASPPPPGEFGFGARQPQTGGPIPQREQDSHTHMETSPAASLSSTFGQTTSNSFRSDNRDFNSTTAQPTPFELFNLNGPFSTPSTSINTTTSIDPTFDTDPDALGNLITDDPFYLLQYGDWDWST
ncbi:hypothetical protein A1O1_06138 [Capronia coronata CBS 617.96]|uniref:Xylanolytic transcriptional activator regulatory domain-containing protein n=1 Tax=Capronia coronata CBS 617.96 TaxID=1182541 RepID=W9Y806_9EURO|nr:uncharacterized protein A1O1_06138 [Capronia coronata CBS 617.96]EXJ85770.1 hypothetical protein A1O1_06138 [Capronia coronata CBS 617.96]